MRNTFRALAAVTAGLTIAATPAGAATRPHMPLLAQRAQAAPAHQVLLPDGQRDLVRVIAGRTEVDPVSHAGSNLSVMLGVGGRNYDLPYVALPYLGRGLDPGLFDVSALLTSEAGGRIPVSIRYHGTTVPRLPGITITGHETAVARGYLTAASARQFYAGLAHQYLTDHDRGSYGTDGMFAGGVSVSLAGTRATRGDQPRSVMKTLTVMGTDLAGKPDTGDPVLLFSVDNGYLNGVVVTNQAFYHGMAKFSVPVGHYLAVGSWVTMIPHSVEAAAAHLDFLPQFSVTADTTIHLAARAATSQITMVTPRPARPESSDFSILRTCAHGPVVELFISTLNARLWVDPTRERPTVGTMRAYAAQQLASPAGKGMPYQYQLSYIDPPGLIPLQTYHVRQAGLASITDTFYQDLPSIGQWSMFGTAVNAFPPEAGYINPYPYPLNMPGTETRYIGGNVPATMWGDYYDSRNAAGQLISDNFEMMRTIAPGSHLADGWNQNPLHPGPNVNPDPASVYNESTPSASREGDRLTISVTPFEDNQPGHYGPGFTQDASGDYQIAQNGKIVASGKIASGPSGTGAFTTQATLAPAPSTVSFKLDASRIGPTFPLSTATSTVWTWRSSHESGDTLPQGWYCDDATMSSHCRVEPMMTLWYHVQRMALNGSTPAGQQVIDITAGHIQSAASPAITGMKVQVSLDGGAHWRTAAVTSRGDGNYHVQFSATAGAYVMLRTMATDAAGGSITESIVRAYRTA